MNPAIIAIAIQELPGVIAWLKMSFAKRNPNAPMITDEDAIAAYQEALKSSLAKDAAWLSAHPKPVAIP